MINTQLKKVLWDSIGKEQVRNLWIRISLGTVTIFVTFSVIKYFPLTYSSAMRNISPLFALVFSCLCLDEPPNLMQVCMLLLVTALVTSFVLTGDDDGQSWTLSQETKGL